MAFHCEASGAFAAPVVVVSYVFLVVHAQSTLAVVGFVTLGAMVFPCNVVEHVVNVLFIFTLLGTPTLMHFFRVRSLKNLRVSFIALNFLDSSYFLKG